MTSFFFFISGIIPHEIEKMGKEAVEIYYEALSGGKQKIPYCNMLILGSKKVGKTSLYRQLVGKCYLEKMDSTRGIDNNKVDIVDARQVDISKWEQQENTEVKGKRYACALYESFNHKLKRKRGLSFSERDIKSDYERVIDLPIMERNDKEPEQFQTVNVDQPSLSDWTSIQSKVLTEEESLTASFEVSQNSLDDITAISSTSLVQSSKDNEILTPEQSSMIDTYMKGGLEYEIKEPSLILNTLDFAGEKDYRPMHHCFILPRALYIVVFKIPDMLEYIRKNAGDNPLDDIFYWIQSIKAHTCPSPKEVYNGSVLLIGTHRDKPQKNTQQDLNDIDDFINELLLLPESSHYVNYIHFLGKDKPSHFIPVENSIDIETGETYLIKSKTKYVQETIKEMSENLPFLKEYYPINWLKFEENLKKEYNLRNSCPVLKIEDAMKLAEKSGITYKAQKDLALKFLHESGKIICLSKEHACLFGSTY